MLTFFNDSEHFRVDDELSRTLIQVISIYTKLTQVMIIILRHWGTQSLPRTNNKTSQRCRGDLPLVRATSQGMTKKLEIPQECAPH